MNKMTYETLKMLFEGTMLKEVQKFIKLCMDGLSSVFMDETVSQYFTVFSAIAASLLIVFFFIDLASHASKDMITMERIVLMFIKLILGFLLLMFLPQIINGLFALVKGVYNTVAEMTINKTNFGITFWGKNEFPPFVENSKDFEFHTGNLLSQIGNNILVVVISGITLLINWGTKIAAYLFAITNALSLVVRAIFSPLAVVQCFEDGQRSSGIRYLKKFTADGLSLAVMIGILFAASVLQSNITGSILQDAGITNITETTGADIIKDNFGLMVSMLAINVSCIGAIMKANSLANDVVGS